MSDGHRLVQMMREAGQIPLNEQVDLVVGTVISIKPLKINVEGRELTKSFLTVGPLCRLYVIYTQYETGHTHPVTDTYTGGGRANAQEPPGHRHEIIMWRGIIPGDKVIMVKVGKGQRYYVLQREEGLSNEDKIGLKMDD